MIKVLIIQTVVIMFYMTGWFVIALARKRNDFADIAWGTGFIVVAMTGMFLSSSMVPRRVLALFLVVIWGVRLAVHIYVRNKGKPEDHRYQKWRQAWGANAVVRAFFQVFIFQGLLIVIISLPVTFMMTSTQHPLGTFDIFGVSVWIVGFVFEAVGDYQLVQYKRDPANKGKIMTQGLWNYTRHPNYFGEVVLWWGMYLMALPVSYGWASILGPLTITFLILKVSGIPLLEEKYKDDPEFQAYKRRTSAFFPLPPRKEA